MKYLGKKVYIQYLRMISRYLYNLQIYNVLILVSLSIEENLVCSQARWGWIFLARPRIVRFPSVISLHLSRDLMANILEFWPLTSRVAAWTGVSYHWISPISSSPQWCPGSAPAWRPPGCRERVCARPQLSWVDTNPPWEFLCRSSYLTLSTARPGSDLRTWTITM